MSLQILTRDVPPRTAWTLEQAGVHPLLSRLFAARGIQSADELDDGLAKLLPPHTLKGTEAAAILLADAIAAHKRLCIVADYDCDGATACAVGLRGLRMLGAQHVSYIVPDRVVDGYGLTAPIAQRVHQAGADLLITVDNGIASMEGVAQAQALGLQVLVTDHHLPAAALPSADVIVNPNQPGCSFESKALAGVGVMFYVLLALRAELRKRGLFTAETQPKLDALLPLVALGTVADVVKLDANNRRLVAQGLARVRKGQMPPGMQALFAAAGRQSEKCTSQDFGFALGPRINAAGRLTDMSLGIRCLTTDDDMQALELARELDNINRERRQIETVMKEQALEATQAIDDGAVGASVCVFHPEWHQGVVGLVASRLKEKYFRPTIAFAPSGDNEIRGSGRSIPDVHLRDVLDLISKRNPGLIHKFGGHAMAAGLTMGREHFDQFQPAFEAAVVELTGRQRFEPVIETDGSLESGYANAQVAVMLQKENVFDLESGRCRAKLAMVYPDGRYQESFGSKIDVHAEWL